MTIPPELEKYILPILEIPSRLEKIESDLLSLHTKVDALLNVPKSNYVTIADICQHFGRSREWIRGHPWSMPNFGVPEMGLRPMKWRRSTWETWLKKLDDHKLCWANMSLHERVNYVQGGTVVSQV